MIIVAIVTMVFLYLFSHFCNLNTKWNQLTALVTIAVYITFIDVMVSFCILSAEKS